MRSTKFLPNYSFEDKGIDNANVSSINKKICENSNVIIKPFSNSSAFIESRLPSKKYPLDIFEGKSLATTSFRKDDDNSSTFLNHHLRNYQIFENNAHDSLEDGEHIGMNQENMKPSDNLEYERSRKKQKTLGTKMRIMLNLREKINTIKEKKKFISNNDNVKEDIKREKTKITTTHFSTNQQINKIKKDFKTMIRSRTTQQDKNVNNKVSNMAIQLLESQNGM